MKKTFNEAVSVIRDGINHSPALGHIHLAFTALGAGACAYTGGNPVAGLATGTMLFFTLLGYHYEGRMYREKNNAPKP